jgi:nucleotide-binding universal stress UspA family protein
MNVAKALGFGLQVATFAVDIPPVASPLGGFLIDVEGMAKAAEDCSAAESARLRALVEGQVADAGSLRIGSHRPVMGAAPGLASVQARYFDLALVPWSADSQSAQDMAQSLVFGSGLPVLIVPPGTEAAPVDHIAVAWDESRVAARAMGDALRLLPDGGKVTVLTVEDEKALSGPGLAQALAASLTERGHAARAVSLTLGGKTIAAALQDAARAEGARVLAMGGFGHSRLRDFILGGATKGVLADLRMATLLAH